MKISLNKHRFILISIALILVLWKILFFISYPKNGLDGPWLFSCAFDILRRNLFYSNYLESNIPFLGPFLYVPFAYFLNIKYSLFIFNLFSNAIAFLLIYRYHKHKIWALIIIVLCIINPYFYNQRIDMLAFPIFILLYHLIHKNKSNLLIKLIISTLILAWCHPLFGIFFITIQLENIKHLLNVKNMALCFVFISISTILFYKFSNDNFQLYLNSLTGKIHDFNIKSLLYALKYSFFTILVLIFLLYQNNALKQHFLFIILLILLPIILSTHYYIIYLIFFLIVKTYDLDYKSSSYKIFYYTITFNILISFLLTNISIINNSNFTYAYRKNLDILKQDINQAKTDCLIQADDAQIVIDNIKTKFICISDPNQIYFTVKSLHHKNIYITSFTSYKIFEQFLITRKYEFTKKQIGIENEGFTNINVFLKNRNTAIGLWKFEIE